MHRNIALGYLICCRKKTTEDNFNMPILHHYLFCYTTDVVVSVVSEFEMAPSVSVNFISLVTSCVELREEEPHAAHPLSFTWASHIAASMVTRC